MLCSTACVKRVLCIALKTTEQLVHPVPIPGILSTDIPQDRLDNGDLKSTIACEGKKVSFKWAGVDSMAHFVNAEAPDAWKEREAQFEQHPKLETLMEAWGHTSWDLQGEKRKRGSLGSPILTCPSQKLPEHPSLASLPLCSAVVIDEL